MAYNVDGLTAYAVDNKEVILGDIVFGNTYGSTIPVMEKQLGVKGSARIHPTSIEANLQDGSGCTPFQNDGGLTITDKTIETEKVKVNLSFCPDTLIGKFAEYKVRVAANPDALPFEAEIVEGLVKDINKKVEKKVWEKLGNEAAAEFAWSDVPNATTAYDRVLEVYKRMDERVLEDGIIFVSPAVFREYVLNLVDKNLYHYNPANGALEEIFIPGAGVKVRKANGLEGTTIYGTSPKNMVYATDFMGNEEEVKIWYSDDNDEYRVKVKFNFGAAFIFSELVTKGRD